MLLSLDNRRVYFDLAGPQNAPVVCFTHSLNADGGMWVEQMVPLLGAGYRVLRLDMRGHGGSAPVEGDYTMDALAADVRGALDVLGIRKVHFVGLSIGGMIGQGFALANPDRLLSLTLCDTLPGTPPASAASWDERKSAVRKSGAVEVLADSSMERWFTPEFRSVNPTRWREIRDTISNTTLAGFLGCAAAIQTFDYESRLPTIKTPTLVICGDEDPGTPPDSNKLIASKIPGGRYEGIANARHLPNVERPEQFNRIMMSWLAANR
ncbi:alpha/beta fold hydrolase [Enhydrobacter sp.]|jgi:3-oxoadipate enol-lactonase|uniref:alpha/beta fold hydrolase n=1 Tax=Enhydrobacter sp. TaxID=1894999 RepID=UPI00262CF82E|nr:alpha/beta fold hydrolase [Enhydrobacter sp.]WIM09992.1 MAG: Beta-ketoadipate enol-lactone hydrolase [Enhydrobacter sp.]